MHVRAAIVGGGAAMTTRPSLEVLRNAFNRRLTLLKDDCLLNGCRMRRHFPGRFEVPSSLIQSIAPSPSRIP